MIGDDELQLFAASTFDGSLNNGLEPRLLVAHEGFGKVVKWARCKGRLPRNQWTKVRNELVVAYRFSRMQEDHIVRGLVFKILGARNPQHSCGIGGDVLVYVKATAQADGLESNGSVEPLLSINRLGQRPVDMPATARVDDGRLG